ncbi:bifunctional acetate--CoA ligase family protein/GNAT family N-acetyltransferase [Limibaculum sp. M0105]|uniref:Bifunctional acetate--CoA ligase family protein/GNAT family N-acetyltransferase n=1 Tax=Thermohalobaculum xanthum TaxID=2753746 RepID=A0A8J7SG68_9RHOB|nr:bifunctional acetate--CoA ligase family protein/GNAT family N-acetyltransferase [Thermohalobaculum xanthum]MBK0399987.1 bifunctional acetate--CoA ligase family protein/GNAT family N-acetyltransferase [Thermohalobaculum xanthum]
MSVRGLDAFFSPSGVAVIGATERDLAPGRVILESILRGGFEGDVHPVNLKHRTVLGRPAVASVSKLDPVPELAIIVTPAATVPGIIEEFGAAGGRAAVVISAGMTAESGLRDDMLAAARHHGVRILGANSIGLIRPRLGLNASFAHLEPQAGRLAFVSQSGAIVGAMIDWAAARGIGFSHIVSLGDTTDVTVADMLDHLAADIDARAILLYLERITDAQHFMSAARAAARIKPVIALKAGLRQRRAQQARLHSGALAGSDEMIEAALERAGILRIRSLDEMFDAAEILGHHVTPGGERLAILGNGTGAGLLAADAMADFGESLAPLSHETCERIGALLPPFCSHANPVNILGDADPERYRAAMTALLDDRKVDAVLVIHAPTALASPGKVAGAVAEAARAQRASGRRAKPVLASWLGERAAAESRATLDEVGIPVFSTPVDAVRAWGHLTRRNRLLERLSRVPPAMSDGRKPDWDTARRVIREAAGRGASVLNEAEAKAVIGAAGIPTVRTLAASDAAGARKAASALSRDGVARFAVKILSDDIAHKSDVGGVVLDLDSPAAVEVAAARILLEAAQRAPSARISGLSVQEMLRRPDAHELIAGIAEDPRFGPVLLFGAGGLSVEVVNDKAVALPPLDTLLATDLVARTRIARLLGGYRNRPAADMDAIGDVLIRLGEIACNLPMIRELDVNPLIASPSGVIALDAKVVIDPDRLDERVPNSRLAIHPYPAEWEGTLDLADGSQVICRPIRPEDAALYVEAFDRMDPDDLRLRFFGRVANPDPRMIAALTQIDYARAMAFAAIDPGDGGLLGVSRLSRDADFERAEYSIAVRSDLKGKGLGWALMTRLIEYARSAGIAELYGEVLPENRAMLRMCADLGFRAMPRPSEGTVHVVLDLRDGDSTRA